jgi:hypothetical protein
MRYFDVDMCSIKGDGLQLIIRAFYSWAKALNIGLNVSSNNM